MLDNSLKVDAFKLKGRLFTLTVLELSNSDILSFETQLKALVKQAPKMFIHTPVVLEISALKGRAFDLKGICEIMHQEMIVPVAVQGASVNQQKAAVNCGLAVISSSIKKEAVSHGNSKKIIEEVVTNTDTSEVEEKAEPTSKSNAKTKLIRTPVRSGQQIYAKGDLIVLASVGHGAELLADGHIHVYGKLGGRALAGINGDENARIYCQQLDAELVSIAGQYVIHDVISKYANDGAKQVYLADGHLKIENL